MIDPKRKRKELRRQVAEWMKRAEHDLSVGEDLAKRSWYPDACFFAQQAAEKALKAFLRSRGAVIRGHRIEDLLEHSARCGLPVSDLLALTDDLRELSDQYIAPRYPNFVGRTKRELEDYDEELSEACLALAKRILARVRAWLGSLA